MVQHVSMETLTILVNVLVVLQVIIVKHGIIVTIKPATSMVNVRMEKLTIPVSVDQGTEEQTVNLETIVIVTHVNMEHVLTQMLAINVHVLQDI